MRRAWETAGWVLLPALIGAELWAWLGPRKCPACRQPRTVADRIRGRHECDWSAC